MTASLAWYLFSGAVGLMLGGVAVALWFDTAHRAGMSAAEPPRPWIVDGEGMWWMPCEGGGYVSTHDSRPPSAFSYDQVVLECGLRRIVPGGPARLDAPPAGVMAGVNEAQDAAPDAPAESADSEHVGGESPAVERLGEPMPRRVVLPPPGFERGD